MDEVSASRGDQTRDALIKAATRIFGKAGFDAASTRAIARAADTNQALINYHFGGKEGLYQAVFQEIASAMETAFTPALERLMGAMPLQGQDAIAGIDTLVATLLEQLGRDDLRDWARLIAREQQDPSPAFEVVYQRFMSRILDLLSSLLTAATGGRLRGEAARLRATLLVAQVLIFIYAPAVIERYLGWESLDTDNREAVYRQMQQIVRSQLNEVEP